jgi:NADH-quinone oxidoreductase subunit L
VIPALPALGATVLLLFGKRIGEPLAGWLATIIMALAFVVSVVTFGALFSLDAGARTHATQGYTWISSGAFHVDFRFLVDPLSTTMILFVTGVGTLIHLYSIGYMHGDPRFSRFFGYMNLFAASMLTLVLGNSFLVTFVGWEGVGLCSYLLISFWFERNSAAVAGKKAFVTNRVGDFGFMLAMFLIFSKIGTLDYSGLAAVGRVPSTTVTVIALLLLLGAVGKSAQLPLYFWLPDAMEGPTPVSALIHAATMVTAGVFLVCRTHAYFKALLFLGAGAVIHGLHDEQDMRRMGGLRKYMPITAGTFIVGWLAIAGIFPFAGFWSKDEILAKAWGEGQYALWFIGAVTALLTAFYMTRQVWLVFYGDERWREPALVEATGGAAHRDEDSVQAGEPPVMHEEAPPSSGAHEDDHDVVPHEAPGTMAFPLVALAGLSIIGGFINLPFAKQKLDLLTRWLEPVFHGVPEASTKFSTGFALSTVALVIAVVGIVLGRAFYKQGLARDGTDPVVERLGPFATVLANAYYLDVGLARFVSGPGTAFANFLARGIDHDVIDGAVNGIATGFREIGGGLRRVQTGLVRNYALGIVLGAVALVIWFTTRVTF